MMINQITVRAIAVIETHRSLHGHDVKGATNIMSRHLQSSYIYMEESLLSFADKVVELSGREWIDGSKVQVRKRKRNTTWHLSLFVILLIVAATSILGRYGIII